MYSPRFQPLVPSRAVARPRFSHPLILLLSPLLLTGPDMQLTNSPSLTLLPQVSWLLWPVALLLGVGITAGSLSYSPSGRINVLWIWLLWAGLPLLGSVASLWAMFFGSGRPWLFQWRNRTVHWHPSKRQRLEMLALLQSFWLLIGVGMLVGYWLLLLFTDLAFGWSSTLIDEQQTVLALTETIATPWQWLWPAAVPDASVIESTRYIRIAPNDNIAAAGEWWPFLMASLLCYNLLPRLVLRGLLAVRLRHLRGHEVNVRAPQVTVTTTPASAISEASPTDWQNATVIHWEIRSDAGTVLGIADWQHDEAAFKALLADKPQSLLWRVNASRSPVAELSDLIQMARTAGITRQALQAMCDATTDPARHLASWRAFANQQQLVWLKETA